MGTNDNDLAESLYDKTYTCPFCKSKIKSKEIRKGKTVFVELDLGLRGKYEPIMPDYYFAIVCSECGYAGVAKNFEKLSAIQIKNIKEKIHPNYKPKVFPPVYDANVAIERYKLALYFAEIKSADFSEKAYIAQKIGLIYGDIGNIEEEQKFLKYAYSWDSDAYIEEDFPIFGIEEPQFLYNLAYLAYRIDKKDEAKRHISEVMTNRDISATLKEKVEDFMEILKE